MVTIFQVLDSSKPDQKVFPVTELIITMQNMIPRNSTQMQTYMYQKGLSYEIIA